MVIFSGLLWLIAIGWAAWTKQFVMAILLLALGSYQFYQIRKWRVPDRWMIFYSLLQAFWIVTALYIKMPWLLIGSLLQYGLFSMMVRQWLNDILRYETMSENYSQQGALLYELRRERHDLQKHAEAIFYAKEGYTYREKLHARFQEIGQALKGESNIVAGALYSWLRQADEKNVHFELSLQTALSGLPLNDFELITFIGNIIENALDASIEYQAITGERASIICSCRKQSGIWILICKNKTVPLPEHVIHRLYTKRAVSTKGEEHEGLGTQEIKRIVRSYDGTLDFSVIKNEFTLKIKLPDVRTVGQGGAKVEAYS